MFPVSEIAENYGRCHLKIMAKLYGELTNLTITTENVTTSSSLVNTTTFEPESSYEYKILVGIALQALVCMTVGGNILVLLSVAINRKLRTTTNYLVVSLAAADLLIGSLVLPFSAILQLEKRWLFGSMFCDIWASTDVLCCTASILSLCAISIDRYIGVTHPLKHRVSCISFNSGFYQHHSVESCLVRIRQTLLQQNTHSCSC